MPVAKKLKLPELQGIKLGYKVLCKSDRSSSHRGALRYLKHKWTVPEKNCGPLCVFTNKKDANDFGLPHLWNSAYKVVPVLYIPSRAIYAYRKSPFGSLHRKHIDSMPDGKALAKAVFCLE